MKIASYLLSIVFLLSFTISFGQNVEILNASLNSFGQVQLEIEGRSDQYYLLHASHQPNLDYESITSLTMGQDGIMIVSEPLASFPYANYTITAHSIANPDDSDGDGIDDITEYNNMPTSGVFNYADEIPFEDGTLSIDNHETFASLAVVSEDVFWAPFLNNQEFVKFAIVNQNSDNPEVYFINSVTHFIHADFLNTIGVNQFADDVMTGEVVYNPNEILPNGAIGSYSVNYSFGDAFPFDVTRRTFELIAANMPYLDNNLQHFIGSQAEDNHEVNYKDDFVGSRIPVVFESGVFADVPYIPLNQAEGYGFFRLMGLDDNPGSRDIVLYEALPNSLPRVGGIITSVVQTPLSHVNLRAIQDNLPNSYIKDPLEIEAIASLLGKFIYYKVEQENYTIREATQEEVNAWYENIRPTTEQIPERDLSITSILPLDEIGFEMSTAFGAKCSNVATMRKFGFPEGTIPDGFGIPFYFYDEFMKFNGFYEKVEQMISDPEFNNDLEVKIETLKDFRKEIRDADMPQWMLDELQEMHDKFPEGTSVRCRSSTNNEDLPGFSGAGLYTSKTQHPDEGHISKSVKQVYASMWNFRAYDEREFYRVDQYIAAMGLLCHPNYDLEKSNGVGVSLDPLYGTEGNFYLNTQIDEFLITNPDANSIPEEILLSQDPEEGYFVLRNSNLVPNGQLVMDEEYLNLMREYLQVIHDEFAILYDVVGAEGYGMDIEYKVTAEDRLIIKQARPWVSFWADIKANFDLAASEILEPISSSTLTDSEMIKAVIANTGLEDMKDFTVSLLIEDEVIETIQVSEVLPTFSSTEIQFITPQDFSEFKDYSVGVIVSHPEDGYERNDTLINVITKLYGVEGSISIEEGGGSCGEEIHFDAIINNLGDFDITDLQIEVLSNGQFIETIDFSVNIPRTETEVLEIIVSENIQAIDNEVTFNLISVNGQPDALSDNNSATIISDIPTNYNFVTVVINPDMYPEEITWTINDLETDEIIDTGGLVNDQTFYTKDVCVDTTSCFTITIFDSYGDGICCFFGEGNISVLNSSGDTLAYNNGDFGSSAQEEFCFDEGVTSTFDFEILTDIKIFPNPTNDVFVMSLNNNTSVSNPIIIEIYDNLGRQLKSEEIKPFLGSYEKEISLENYEPGCYLIKCRSGSTDQLFKVIKL